MALPAALPPPGSPRPPLADGAGRHRAPPGGGPGRCPPSSRTGTTWRTGPPHRPARSRGGTRGFPDAGWRDAAAARRTGSLRRGGRGRVPRGTGKVPQPAAPAPPLPGAALRARFLAPIPDYNPQAPGSPLPVPGSPLPVPRLFPPGSPLPAAPEAQVSGVRDTPEIRPHSPPGHPRAGGGAPGRGTRRHLPALCCGGCAGHGEQRELPLQWERGKAAPRWEQKGPSGQRGVPGGAQGSGHSKPPQPCRRRRLLLRCARPGTAAHRMWAPIIQVAESLMGWIHR